MRHELYGPGGFDPEHPHMNLVECYDTDAGLFTTWDENGERSSRPMTDTEHASFLHDLPNVG